MKLLKLAFKNVWHNPLNLVLSIILFGLGVGLINFLILTNAQLKEKFDANLASIDLVIGAKGSPLQMILSNMYHIDNPTGNINIDEAKAFLNPKHPLIKTAIPLSLGDNFRSFRIVGTTPPFLDLYRAKLANGSLWQNNLEVTIGRAVADATNLKIGDTFYSSHGFNDDEDLAHKDTDFKVVGVLEPTGTVIDQLILCSPSTVWAVHEHAEDDHDYSSHPSANSNLDLLNFKEKDITSILIQYKNKTNFQALNMPRAINENTDMQAASPAIEINRLYSLIGVGTQMLRSLAFLIAIISAVSIFIMLFKSMKERKYELALIRVMGGQRSSLFLLIIFEGLILAGIGFVFGFLLSHIGLGMLSSVLESSYKYSFTGWKFLPSEWLILALSLGLGLIAAIIPAIQASRTDINETLGARS